MRTASVHTGNTYALHGMHDSGQSIRKQQEVYRTKWWMELTSSSSRDAGMLRDFKAVSSAYTKAIP